METLPGNHDAVPRTIAVKAHSIRASLKRAERRALDYLLDNPGRIAGASIVVTARHAGCSEATFSRLARRLGCSGFPDLKKRLASEPGQDIVYKGITENDQAHTVVEKVFAATCQSLQDTLNVLDKTQFQKAVDTLVAARRILLCGMGDAFAVAMAVYQKFVRVGTDAQTSDDPDTQLIFASHLTPGDVVIAISHSGRSTTIMNTAREAARRGAAVIAVTNFPYSPLAKAADIVLLTADFAEHLDGEVISKRISELCILESLYINYLIGKNGALHGARQASDEAVKAYKE